jgi:hypothetical protein
VPRPLLPALALAALLLASGMAYAQFGGQGFGGFGLFGEQGDAAESPPLVREDRKLSACHILYTSVRREANGAGWRTDYPWGERRLLIRLSELTKTKVSFLSAGTPHAYLVRLNDERIFDCSYLTASDVGTIGLSPDEALGLRRYLEKGGFLWVDDFWGDAAWAQWSREFSKAMPPDRYPIEDVPLTDPIFHMLFDVQQVPQVTSIRFWRASGGRSTSERGAESATPHLRGIRDAHGNLIAVMTHNTDIADSFEREGDDPQFFYQFSPNGYAMGINILLYAMTH